MKILSPSSIKRVVTCFILSPDEKVAVFQRQATMPTFPSHWAGISGSIEPNETPWQTAQRELLEETNWSTGTVDPMGGLFLDVPVSDVFPNKKVIRVYPFIARISQNAVTTFDIIGTEHDQFQFISIPELYQLNPTVPGLVEAFHRATMGKYLDLPPPIRAWQADRVNGAATLAKQAVNLAIEYPGVAQYIPILRPTMVPIANAVHAVIKYNQNASSVLQSLQEEAERCIQQSATALEAVIATTEEPVIATFSRSSTILKIIQTVLEKHPNTKVICAKSIPGGEGELMAQDFGINAVCVEDEKLEKMLKSGTQVNAFVVGADCILPETAVVNKVGTERMAKAAREGGVPSFCCSDRYKVWDDIFPPPLEEIFEVIPCDAFDQILVPEAQCNAEQQESV